MSAARRVARTDRPARRRKGPEAAWQATVCDLLDVLGYTWAHFRKARTAEGRHLTPVAGPGGAGYPDLTAWRPVGRRGAGRVVFLELKAEGRYPTPLQRAVLASLADSWAEAYVGRPRHFDLLREVLGASAPPSPDKVAALQPWRRDEEGT